MTQWLSSVNGNDANNGTTKALANQFWDTVTTGAENEISAGEDLYLDSAHVETYAANWVMTLPGTLGNPNRLIAINWSTENYQGSVVDNFLSSTGDITILGCASLHGIRFSLADDLQYITADNRLIIVDGKITLSGAGSLVSHGNANGGNVLILKNTDVDFTGGGDGIFCSVVGELIWEGGTVSFAGTQPTAFFASGTRQSDYAITGVDLSAITSTLFGLANTAVTKARVVNCILSASLTNLYDSIGHPDSYIEFIGCDDTTGNSLIRYQRATFYGDITDDTGVYLSTSEGDGTTKYSHKMASNANALEYSEPLTTAFIPVWVGSTGSKTFTIEIVHDSATALQDDEVWMELFYHDLSTDTQIAITNDRTADILATPANQTTSSVTWTGTSGFANENKQKLSVTATVNRISLVFIKVHLALASKTIYINTEVDVT